MNEIYLYPYSAAEALKRNELSLWRESHRANIACRDAIEDAIRRNFDGMHLNEDCITPVLDEYGYKLKHQSLPILEQMLETLQTIRDRRLLWSEDIVSLNKKISELSSQNQTLAFLKQNGLVDPDIFISKSNELTRQLRQAKLDKEELMAAEGDATAQRTQELIALLEDGPDFLDHPDTELCGALVAEIIVESNDTLRFRLHNGLELRESIERTVR